VSRAVRVRSGAEERSIGTGPARRPKSSRDRVWPPQIPSSAPTILTDEQSAVVVHRVAGDVKLWTDECPPVEDVRPGQCPCCGLSARGDRRLVIVGHGVVERQRLGPAGPGTPPEVAVQKVRRYRCRACGHVMRVTHAALLRCKHYGAAAIAMALGLWGIEQTPAELVRAEVSPWRQRDPGGSRWRSLARWASGAAAGALWRSVSTSLVGTARSVAERCARVLVAQAAMLGGGLRAQLCAAAEHAR
jgi:hypothetical protein